MLPEAACYAQLGMTPATCSHDHDLLSDAARQRPERVAYKHIASSTVQLRSITTYLGNGHKGVFVLLKSMYKNNILYLISFNPSPLFAGLS